MKSGYFGAFPVIEVREKVPMIYNIIFKIWKIGSSFADCRGQTVLLISVDMLQTNTRSPIQIIFTPTSKLNIVRK